MRIGVIGAGFVGLVTGACLARHHDVVVVERDARRIADMKTGRMPFFERGLADAVDEATAQGRLRFAAAPDALADRQLCFVAVGTPPCADGSSDVSMVVAAADAAGAHLPQGAVLAIRSTVPPGTNAAVQARLQAAGRGDVTVVSTPEFLAEGTAVADFQAPARLVFGGAPEAVQTAAAAFAQVRPEAPRIFTTWATAELCKYAANAFLAARVSLINEFARLCDAFDGDVTQVARAVGLDERIGAGFLRAGIGYGGSCFPKDVQAIAAAGAAAAVPLDVIPAVEAANHRQWRHAVDEAGGWIGGWQGRTVGVWGLAFKPGTDDVREAPALRVIDALQAAGAGLRVHDPEARLDAQAGTAGWATQGAEQVVQVPAPEDAAAGADIVIHVTEWEEYRHLDWPRVAAAMATPRIFDARNALPHDALESAGIAWRGIGVRPAVAAPAEAPQARAPGRSRA